MPSLLFLVPTQATAHNTINIEKYMCMHSYSCLERDNESLPGIDRGKSHLQTLFYKIRQFYFLDLSDKMEHKG